MTPLPPDFSEFLRLLNENDVRYLLIGGHAVGFHGHVRGTGDIDVWVDTKGDNPERIIKALGEFGFRGKGVSAELFRELDQIVRMGVPPLRIEVMTSISGVDFDECYQSRLIANWGGSDISIISLPMLRKNKRASARLKDLEDLKHLEGKEDRE